MMEKWETTRIADTGHDAGREYVALLEANSRVAGLQQRITDLVIERDAARAELTPLKEWAARVERLCDSCMASHDAECDRDLERRLAESEAGGAAMRAALERIAALELSWAANNIGSGRRGAAASDRVSKARAALAEPQEGEGSVPAFPPRVYPSDAPNVTGQKRPDLDLDALAKQGEGASE